MNPEIIKKLCDRIYGAIPCKVFLHGECIEIELSDFSRRKVLKHTIFTEFDTEPDLEMLEAKLKNILAQFISGEHIGRN